MKLLGRGTKTTKHNGVSHILHVMFVMVVPFALFVFVRLDLTALAYVTVLLAKWRMFAVKMRHWPAIIRTNAVDILVGVSAVSFMSLRNDQALQFAITIAYMLWLLFIKPRSSTLWIGLQALISQTVSLLAIFVLMSESSETYITLSVWGVTYLCARHFLAAFDEAMARATAYVWALFCGSLAWLTSHWLLFNGFVSQPALIITVIGYGLAAIYYLQHTERLTPVVRRQFVLLIVAAVLCILVFSRWSGEVV